VVKKLVATRLFPGRRFLAVRGWWDAMPFQNAADRLIARHVAQVGQCSDGPKQQFLIDGPCDVCEQYLPAQTPLHLCFFRSYERGGSARAWEELKPKRR
jgi:hypothetical protein